MAAVGGCSVVDGGAWRCCPKVPRDELDLAVVEREGTDRNEARRERRLRGLPATIDGELVATTRASEPWRAEGIKMGGGGALGAPLGARGV